MSGLHQSELNSTEGEPKVEGKLLTLKEAAELLQLSEEEVRDFVAQGKIPAYKLGGEFLRFKKDQIEALRERIQVLKWRAASEIGVITRGEDKGFVKYSAWERLRDFIYFNDFYFFVAILIGILLFIIFKYK